MIRVSFIVPGSAPVCRRARVGGGRVYTDDATRRDELRVCLAARAAAPRCPVASGPIIVRILALWPRPQSRPAAVPVEVWRAGGRVARPSVPDADNVAKAVLDGLQVGPRGKAGAAHRWLDDDGRVARVESTTAWAAVGEAEATHVEVEAMAWEVPVAGAPACGRGTVDTSTPRCVR